MSIHSQQIEALVFQLRAIAALDDIIAHATLEHVDQQSIELLLAQAGRFAAEELVPLAQSGDLEACHLDGDGVKLPTGTRDSYKKWCELGFPALSLPLDIGGLGFPNVVQSAVQEILDGANLSFGMLPIAGRGAALLLLAHGSDEQKQHWLPKLVSGEFGASICISEPQAGSDVGRIRTAAVPIENNTWQLNGTKIWISYGDHDATAQILHMVLARIPGDAVGTAGLGLFAVPKFKIDGSLNGVRAARLEHKMGLNASPTCEMELKDAEGILLGEPGKGIQAMFVMMNSMRLAVAVQGVSIANAATLHAIEYASQRPQGGKPTQSPPMITQHADVKRMLLEMTARSELMRALSLRISGYLDKAISAADEGQKKRCETIAELLLPIAKTLGAETAFEVGSQAIQVMGGYGYTNEYPVERLVRDSRILAIYEGTSGIQALDLLKRKVCGDNGTGLRLVIEAIQQSRDKASEENPFYSSTKNLSVILEETFQKVKRLQLHNSNAISSGAYAYLQLAGQVVYCWCGLDLMEAATGDSLYQQRLRSALTLFANSAEQEAGKWAHRAVSEVNLLEIDAGLFSH